MQDLDIRAKLTIRKVEDGDPGNELIQLKGEFLLPAESDFQLIDPLTNGILVLLFAEDGTILVETVIPGGEGWKTNSKQTKYNFTDKTRPAVNNGLTKVSIQDRSKKTPGQVKISLKGKDSTVLATSSQRSEFSVLSCFSNAAARPSLIASARTLAACRSSLTERRAEKPPGYRSDGRERRAYCSHRCRLECP